jgi:hypothetical protein
MCVALVCVAASGCANSGGPGAAPASLSCEQCGTVLSVERVYSSAANISAGAAWHADVGSAQGGADRTGSVGKADYARSISANPVGVQTSPRYIIEVLMSNGRTQSFSQALGSGIRVGDQVRVDGGRVLPTNE